MKNTNESFESKNIPWTEDDWLSFTQSRGFIPNAFKDDILSYIHVISPELTSFVNPKFGSFIKPEIDLKDFLGLLNQASITGDDIDKILGLSRVHLTLSTNEYAGDLENKLKKIFK